ncbi:MULTISPECIES: ABC transporter permease [Oerskovia]|uniref:Transport permease protein n=1 Tax=Oerskovia merdavium TaxID=2762227 RepID=A0ABR8TUZ0_9CELL|nr:ABC transporter permease [Oerskovia merdavium]MBD7979414.1 ABC transporter permease [Oerskovia merdavium]
MVQTVITPPGRFAAPNLREMWNAREVLYRFGMRDIVLRYRQTAVGVVWVLLQPLVSAGIFSIVFGQVAGLSSDGKPYFIFSFVGMLAWNLFSQVLNRSAGSMVGSQALISKVYFPRILVPLSGILSVFVDFVIALGLCIVLLFVYGINPGWPVLLLPLWAVLIAFLGAGLGLAASAIMVRYRDVAYVLPWLVQTLMFASPVAYSVSDVPSNLTTLFNLNPLAWFLDLFRWSLLGTPAPEPWKFVGAVVVSLLVLTWGMFVFQKFEREFADVI